MIRYKTFLFIILFLCLYFRFDFIFYAKTAIPPEKVTFLFLSNPLQKSKSKSIKPQLS